MAAFHHIERGIPTQRPLGPWSAKGQTAGTIKARRFALQRHAGAVSTRRSGQWDRFLGLSLPLRRSLLSEKSLLSIPSELDRLFFEFLPERGAGQAQIPRLPPVHLSSAAAFGMFVDFGLLKSASRPLIRWIFAVLCYDSIAARL